MRDYESEVREDIRATHGDRFVSMFDRKAEQEIQAAIDLYKLMTDEERDMILKVRDDYQALSDLVAKVKARIGE